jgi:hypothetical protein
MAAVRKNAPPNIREIIEQYVAGEGGSTVILGRVIGVSDSTVRKWFAEDESLKEEYDGAREAYMHKLYLELIQMSRAGKGNVAGLIFTLKAKFKQYDMPGSGKLVDVNVNNIQPVMVVRDFGDDAAWAARVAAQQRALTAECSTPLQIEAPQASQVDAVAAFAPPAILPPVYAPQAAPVATVAPSYGPPVFAWQHQGVACPIHALEPIPCAPVAPSWTAEWRPRA